ncbi:hypothetical protein [Methanococcus maripaludis]|jgi:hypothetical protein|uniref:Uncharacterized protein n=2 Tax=Methanococcus maripaludis TaxID=39152 RepID=A0A7J9P3X3_METMI|nr:hypothetical protein [Methanococcus maripaludis]AEK20683.1 hypothetical protein GYY_09160 [Methanococcus maripaludis X1]MBA2857366.1 hypothetical protein [Methanococcus maripaludis]MBM7409703.1 hypothetical protein [Methanococcus maripaludis]MBP2219545.1 hypothetical protein [Methanococcus maripaludis]
MENRELVMETAPYVQNMEYIRELIEESENIEELKIKLTELIDNEQNVAKKTDLKILMEKIEELGL